MKNKFVWLGGGWMLLFVIVLTGASYGAGIVLNINGNSVLTDQTGAGITPTYTGPGSASTANIEFFPGGAPSNPVSTSGRNDLFNYTLLSGPIYQYDNLNINGGNVQIRSWSGTPRTQGSHYGFSSLYAAASGASPAKQYDVSSFQTDWLANVPVNAPVFGSASEASVRQDYTNNILLSLSVPWSYSVGSAPNKIVALSYDVKYWVSPDSEPSDSDPNWVVNTTGTTFVLPAANPVTGQPFSSGTYHFKVRARNSFGVGPWSTQLDWTTLAGGGVCPAIIKTYSLNNITGGLGINTFAIPASTPYIRPSGATYLSDIINEINSRESQNVTYSIGWWDPATMRPAGYEIKYNSTTVNDYSATGTSGLGPINQTTIEMDKAYQIYVIKTTTLTIEGTR